MTVAHRLGFVYPSMDGLSRWRDRAMKSPFSGMDPFIEGCGLWEDFHGHLIEKIGEALADRVPAHYLVRTGERGYVVLADDEQHVSHSFKADISVVSTAQPHATAGTALAEPSAPYSVRAFIEEEFRETFLEIREADGDHRLVTCIEVLSPSNKKPNSQGWELYQRKRQGLFLGHTAHLVEIDLLRAGQRMPAVDRWPDSPYLLMVARTSKMPVCDVWPASFEQPVPPIPVPLLKPDADVMLDLQPLIDAIYARWRYGRSIDYTRPLMPPLPAEVTSEMQERLGSSAI